MLIGGTKAESIKYQKIGETSNKFLGLGLQRFFSFHLSIIYIKQNKDKRVRECIWSFLFN